jgi:predicted DCC family thiol-disulfide oxidoreductase YuxK
MSGIVLFDGVCNLCTGSVQFILPRDPGGYFHFASIQSPAAQAILKRFPTTALLSDSVIVIEGDQMYTRSDAALQIARHLKGAWSSAYVLRFVPKGIRDWIYDWFAAHRYQIFGQREYCLVNSPGAQERFLENQATLQEATT